jgi:hypothetical protein
VALAASVFGAPPATAQDRCRLLCSPSLKLEPTITFSNLSGGPRVRLADGSVEREAGEATFEIILATEVPTAWRRLALTAEVIWAPFAEASVNPFTGRSAAELNAPAIRDNPVELELEANFYWLRADQTRGWVSSHVDVVDTFSPAARAGDRSTYTHKLNFELDTSLALFRWLPDGHWLRRLELEGSLDHVATGLPRAGDEVSPGQVFLDDASPWSFSLVFVIPLAPW